MEIETILPKLHKVAQAITGRLSSIDLAAEAVKVCKEVMEATACSIFLIEEENKNCLNMVASSGYTNDLSNNAPYPLFKKDENEKLGVTAWIAIKGDSFLTNNREDFKNCFEYNGGKYDRPLWGAENQQKCQSFFGAPLKTEDRVLGVLKVESSSLNFFTKNHQNLLEIIGSFITSAISNLREKTALHSFYDLVGQSPIAKNELYNQLTKACANFVNAEACSIFLWDEGINRLVMRGDFGHDISFVDNSEPQNTYERGEGVTGKVFENHKSSQARSKEEVLSDPNHESKLYRRQYNQDHICHSWYQFCVGKKDEPLGVMKIENKLSLDRNPVENGGFNESEKQILEIFANSAVPLIVGRKERLIKDRAINALHSVGLTANIEEIFNFGILDQIKKLSNINNPSLHIKILNFIDDVKGKQGQNSINYLKIAQQHIHQIGKALGINSRVLGYCESLEFYEPILYQLPKYRSHFIHQLNVFLNGYLILNYDNFSFNLFNRVKEIIAERFEGCSSDSIDLFKIWFLTTIFHDTGYPLGKVGDWTQGFLSKIFDRDFDIAPKIVETISIRLFRATFRNSISILINHLLTWLKLEEMEKNEIIINEIHDLFFRELSENLIAGILLIKACEKDDIELYTISTALSAIILDDEKMWKILKDKGIKTQITFIENPIAFLLVYCDNIQEHGRLQSGLNEQLERREASPEPNKFRVIKEEFILSKNNILCELEYQQKPEYWENKVKPIIENIQNFWKSPKDLVFEVSYREQNGGEFAHLHFLKDGPS